MYIILLAPSKRKTLAGRFGKRLVECLFWARRLPICMQYIYNLGVKEYYREWSLGGPKRNVLIGYVYIYIHIGMSL